MTEGSSSKFAEYIFEAIFRMLPFSPIQIFAKKYRIQKMHI